MLKTEKKQKKHHTEKGNKSITTRYSNNQNLLISDNNYYKNGYNITENFIIRTWKNLQVTWAKEENEYQPM